MTTNKVGLKTVEEFMNGYTPTYAPIYPLFLGRSIQYQTEVGKSSLRTVTAVGDIRAKHVTPKDTELHQVGANDAYKTFKKYLLANQFRISQYQDQAGVTDVIAQVLDEHQKQFDELFLLGEGTSNSTMINNSLFWSADSNYVLETSVEIDSTERLYDFHNKVVTTATKADLLAGRKVIMFYGTGVLPLYHSLYDTAAKSWRQAMQETLGPDYTLAKLPASITPANTNGWMIANLDQVRMHYTALPQLEKSGVNEESSYAWFNFIQGSCMLELQASGAVIRQPATLEA